MSYIKDLEESNQFLKSFALSLLTSPLWYLSIFFINNDFYKTTDTTILITLSCTISFISTFSMGLILLLEDKSRKDEDPLFKCVTISSFILTIWKSTLLFIVYSIGFIFDSYMYFYWYIVIYFSIHIIALIIELIPEKKK